jgi:hypothetical protein
MSEAPKKIWLNPLTADIYRLGSETFSEAYIRADLVDPLVKALEEMTELNRVYWKAIAFEPSVGGTFQEVLDKARAALKAMKEE